MSARARTIWTFVITSTALFMASLDNLDSKVHMFTRDMRHALRILRKEVDAIDAAPSAAQGADIRSRVT